MNKEDRTAIEIVKDLQNNLRRTQSNIRNTTLAMATTLVLAVFGATFWGGGINNQVKTNTTNIDKVVEIVGEFVIEQKVANESYTTELETAALIKIANDLTLNLSHIAFWAKSRGYEGLPRGYKAEEFFKK